MSMYNVNDPLHSAFNGWPRAGAKKQVFVYSLWLLLCARLAKKIFGSPFVFQRSNIS